MPVSAATAAAIASWARLKWCTRSARRSGSRGDRAAAQEPDLRVLGLFERADISSIQALQAVDDVAVGARQVPLERAPSRLSMPSKKISSLDGKRVVTVRVARSARSAMRAIVARS